MVLLQLIGVGVTANVSLGGEGFITYHGLLMVFFVIIPILYVRNIALYLYLGIMG
jgi:hypothetical protein